MAGVSVKDVSVLYGEVKALDSITLDFPDGGFFALLGPSGSGKTTLLRAIAGFIFTNSGSISIGKIPVNKVPVEKRDIGMMFQNYALFPNMNVADNIGFGLRVRKVSKDEERQRVNQALDLVKMSGMGNRKPSQLSGGQKQRVALARATVTMPRVLLLDEPLSALDKSLRVDMQFELKRIQRELGITTIFVTHDQEEALTLSDSIGILKEGKMIRSGHPREVYNNPGDRFTAEFLGDANILSAHIADAVRIVPPDHHTPGNALAVRPEHISISVAEPCDRTVSKCRALLVQRVFAGAMATCLLEYGDGTIKVVSRDQDLPSDLHEGQHVWLSWPVRKTLSLSGAAD